MFAGLMPSEIEKMYPQFWDDDDNEGHKNRYEEELLRKQMERFRRKEKLYFDKVSGIRMERRISDNLNSILESDLSVMVFNFVDMISHARTEMDMIKELASDEKAYRSLNVELVQQLVVTRTFKRIIGKRYSDCCNHRSWFN